MYFGSDETLAGQTVGQQLTTAGRRAARRCASSRRRARWRWRPAARGEAGLRRAPRTCRSTAPTCRRCSRRIQSKLAAGPVDHQHRDPGRADRAGRAAGRAERRQHREDRHVRPEPGRRAGDQGRQDRIRRRPAALRAGLPVGADAVDEHHQRQRPRRRQAGADRPVDRGLRPTSTRSCPTPRTTGASRTPGEPAGCPPGHRDRWSPHPALPVRPLPWSRHELSRYDAGHPAAKASEAPAPVKKSLASRVC